MDNATSTTIKGLLRQRVALPQQHGSWVLWLSPFLIGLLVAPSLTFAQVFLALAALGSFLTLQPLTVLVKIFSGRRSRKELASGIFWFSLWMLLAGFGSMGLFLTENGKIIFLGLAALPVLLWQMWLVTKREDRGQLGVEIIGTGALTLVAPAAFWVGNGEVLTGWLLWFFCWFQAAGSIVYIYVRLKYRRMTATPSWPERFRISAGSNILHALFLLIVMIPAALGYAPATIFIPFFAMLVEALYGGLLKPCIGSKPVPIGIRQVMVATLFTVLMIIAYQYPSL